MRRAVRELRNWWRDGVVNVVIFARVVPDPLRAGLMRFCGYSIGRSRLSAGGYVGGRGLRIGNGSFVARNVYLDATAEIEVSDRVQIGPFCRLVTSTHEIGPTDQRAGAALAAPIVVEDGVWLGAAVTVLPGVTIGKGAIIAAGAVVTSDCRSDGLYGGVPARWIREFSVHD